MSKLSNTNLLEIKKPADVGSIAGKCFLLRKL
jgi:hypothetical protein